VTRIQIAFSQLVTSTYGAIGSLSIISMTIL